MSFFIKEENVRPGNRGGRTLFNWNDIRLLNNKERESYLGVTQSIGFLDKGGKWRKRDWWQSKDKTTNLDINPHQIISEKEYIKQEEQRLFNETFNNLYGTSTGSTTNKGPAGINSNQKKEKLTVFEWKELMKKEANMNPNDPKIFEFYENDEHKRGLGMKPNISFRTNPYEKDTMQRIRKLEGEGLEADESDDEAKRRGNSKDRSSVSSLELRKQDKKGKEKELNYDDERSKNRILNSDYMQKKEHLGGKSYAEIMEIWDKEQQERKKLMDYGNLDSSKTKSKSKKEKKEKKDKKEKKNKKDKKSKKRNIRDKRESENDSDASRKEHKKIERRRNRSHSSSRSRSRSKSYSRKKHRD